MISFAGIPLSHPPPDVCAWVRDAIDPSWLVEWCERTWPGKNLTALGFTARLGRGPIRLNSLCWPTGASRWAQGHYLATDGQLAQIRPLVYPSAGGLTPQVLKLDDTQHSVSVSLYMLPPRPLQQIMGKPGFWLLTLVDERFFWWFRAATVTLTAGTTTWAQLYTSIASALGITITADAVPAAYLKPAAELATQYEALPLLLDAAAASCGQRIVRSWGDGSVTAIGPATAKGLRDGQTLVNMPRAGGSFAFTAGV